MQLLPSTLVDVFGRGRRGVHIQVAECDEIHILLSILIHNDS